MSKETDLSNSIVDYANGLTTSVGQAKSSGQLNGLSAAVLKGASTLVPGAQQAAAIAGAVTQTVGAITGQGSVLARVVTASLTSTNIFAAPVNIVKAIIGGRTYQSGDYKLAVLYRFYVKGEKNITNPNQTSDNDVLESTKWFVSKLGIYIQGNATIEALRVSPAAYIALRQNNTYITTDPLRVGPASQVVQLFMPMNNTAGSWAQAIGVFDADLTSLANGMYGAVGILPSGLSKPASFGIWLNTYKIPVVVTLASILVTVVIIKLADR